MNGTQIIKMLMKESGITQTQIAVLVGMQRQTNVSDALQRDIKASLLAKFADALGYELVIRKKRTGRREADCYVVWEPEHTKKSGDKA